MSSTAKKDSTEFRAILQRWFRLSDAPVSVSTVFSLARKTLPTVKRGWIQARLQALVQEGLLQRGWDAANQIVYFPYDPDASSEWNRLGKDAWVHIVADGQSYGTKRRFRTLLGALRAFRQSYRAKEVTGTVPCEIEFLGGPHRGRKFHFDLICRQGVVKRTTMRAG